MPDPITYRQLLPTPATTDARSLLASLPLQHAPDRSDQPDHSAQPDHSDDLPYTLVNFIASADGRATIDGRSGKLGDDGDRELFRSLRERVDAVIAGTNTMATERYGRLLIQPERRRWRVSQGLPPEPLACVVSRSGRVPLEIPLFAEPEAEVVVFSPTPPALDRVAATVRHEPIPADGPVLATALRILRERHGVRTLLCEGGPTLFAALLSEYLVDELYLTLAPRLAGAAGAGSIVGGGPAAQGVIDLRLLTALERNDALYLRYGVGR